MHKGQLASDRTSCQSPLANQLRLVLHTAAYWLMLALRDAIPRAVPLARTELRLRLLKIGARAPSVAYTEHHRAKRRLQIELGDVAHPLHEQGIVGELEHFPAAWVRSEG